MISSLLPLKFKISLILCFVATLRRRVRMAGIEAAEKTVRMDRTQEKFWDLLTFCQKSSSLAKWRYWKEDLEVVGRKEKHGAQKENAKGVFQYSRGGGGDSMVTARRLRQWGQCFLKVERMKKLESVCAYVRFREVRGRDIDFPSPSLTSLLFLFSCWKFW